MTFTFPGLDAQRAFGAKLVVLLVWLMVPVVVVARLLAQGPVMGIFIAATLLAGGATVAGRIGGQGSLGRSLSGVALMAQVSMLLAALTGHSWQIDMHMAYFAALAVLVIYCDWVVIAAGAATVAVHHLALSYLLPEAVFPGSANLARVIVHALILVVEAVVLIGVTVSVNAMFVVADEARRKAEDAADRAQTANDAAQAARSSEEAGRVGFAEAQAQAERQRADALATLAKELSRLAAGDLTARIDAEFDGDFAQMKTDFNAAVDSLRGAVLAITAATDGLRGGSDDIARASDDLARRTESQAASLEQTAAALEQVTQSGRQAALGAQQASTVVTAARAEAERTGGVVRDAVSAMDEIERSSGEITQIIGVIDEIAFQTNLLALNAGVEAARAGDSGRGFAVVAQEVRALAQRSADAAKQIKALIATSSEQVQRGVGLVGQTGQVLEGMVTKVSEIDGIIADMAVSSQEQASGLSQINQAIGQMDRATQQNAAMVEETTAAAGNLRNETVALAQRVSRFRTGGAQTNAVAETQARAARFAHTC
jgi:methyl-accepting chemotaxis protein